jgi:signal transduction histidine kinase/DNA-binding response OmpR family regulator/ligand-binding sensor domain-containing protein
MKIRIILIIFCLKLLNFSTYGQYDPDFFDNYTVIQGQPAFPALGVFKDSQGFIWGLYLSGVYRYDGTGMKHYAHIPGDSTSLSDNLARSILFEDSLNRLWISNFSNNIDILDKNTGKVTRIIPDKTELRDKVFVGLRGGCFDAEGNIIGNALTGYLVKYDLAKNTVKTLLIVPENPDSSVNRVSKVFKDRDNNIWITTGSGLFLYNAHDNSFSRPDFPEDGADLLTKYFISDMIHDSLGFFWISTGNSLLKYDPVKFTIDHFDLMECGVKTDIRGIHEYPPSNGNTLLLRLYDGLIFFNKNNGKIRSYLFDMYDPAYTHMLVYYNEIIDENGRLWITSDNFKMIVFTPEEDIFRHVRITDDAGNQYIGASFCKDEIGNLWVGTAYGGLFKLDTNLNIIDRFQINPEDGFRRNFFFYSLFLDGDVLWVGFAGRGLGKLNLKTRHFEHVLKNEDVKGNPIFRIYEMYRDSFGVLWFCSDNGIFFLDPDDMEKQVRKIIFSDDVDPYAMSVYEDNDRALWFSSPSRGIYYLPAENRADTNFILFEHDENDPKSLATNQISSVCQDLDGNYWIGSDVGLICFYPEDSSFKIYQDEYIDRPLAVNSIKLDHDGYVWFLSEQGITRFTPGIQGEKAFKVISTHEGMPFSEFYPWELHMDRDGVIYIGAVRGSRNGFFYFNPGDLPENKVIPPVVLTSFKVRNEDFEMDTSISLKKEIRLKYDQNYLSFEFVALNYINPKKNNYAYKLEGLDEEWVYCGSRHFANYTRIPPGTYTFRVKGSNNDGYWNEEGASVRIIISPPPWKTWWAYTLYGILFIFLLVAWRRYDLKRLRLKKDLEIEQVEAQKLKEVDKLKSRFFANISHEFRTPLTLILGPLENLRSRISDKESEQEFNIMQRNARRLQQLISQLLNLSKIESGKMKLQTREEDIVSLVRGYVQSFESLAQQKGITLEFNSNCDHQLIYLDRDKVEKILYNLLSNALKYTGRGGTVRVDLTQLSDHVSIKVSDTGAGIPQKHIEHIFDRFYRGDETHHVEGSGIGLALTRELAELHHGEIIVESEAGKGSSFEIRLKKGKEHLSEEEILSDSEPEMDHMDISYTEEIQEDKVAAEASLSEHDLLKNGTRPLMLIVEDNQDLRHYIRGYFSNSYEILEAEDGVRGMEKAKEFLPDIIISDVMMPNMDGYELGEKLKNDPHTSHIPLILLTARASTESKMEGLEIGADDFITKPFDPQELQLRVKNLVIQRQRLSEYYREHIGKPDIRSLVNMPLGGYSQMDREFIVKAVEVIRDQMGNSEFSVEDFSNNIAMSRVQLHRKLKGLLNLSPSDLIRNIRLKKAAELIKKGSGNVTEIAYEVGFSNLSYFAKCFKEEYGFLPSDYRKKN